MKSLLPPISKPLASLLAVSLILGGLPACEKKKGLTFQQGNGDNLYAIGDYNGSTFKIKTGGRRFKGQTSRADKLIVLDKFDGINSLDAVEFRIEEGLFAGVDLTDFNFYGRENHEYTFKYTFTDKNVILMKIAAKADLPSQELTFAKSTGGDQFEVPLMGLPIKLLTVEKVRDERGKDTRKLSTFDKDFLKDATHFKINVNEVKYFESTVKQDLLSSAYFNPNDEWLYTKTIIGRALNSSAILGNTEASLKIKFARTNNSILGIDLNIAKEQEILDPTKTIKVLEIPVEWVDYKLVTSGSDALLKEEKLGDKEVGSAAWEERKYALIDFNNSDRLSRTYTADNKLEKLEINDNYISFTIYESSSGNTYKYSLAKNNTRVAGQNMFADDTKLFHIFAEKRKVIKGALYRQEPDFNRLVYANRFYPEAKEIVYHISENTPNDPAYLNSIQSAVNAWDTAFEKAGTGIRIRLADDRVQMGDVRYNQIGFYGYEIDSTMKGGGMLLGFGPSVQDTRTGQTFVAATHIYLRAYREGIIQSIRNFIRNEIGLYDDKKVADISQFRKADAIVAAGTALNRSSNEITAVASLYGSLQPKSDSSSDRMSLVEADFARQIEQNFGTKALNKSLEIGKQKAAHIGAADVAGATCTYGNVAANANNWRKIRSSCLDGKTALSDYLVRLKEAHASDPRVFNLEGEEAAILECAQPLMPDLLTSTLIHELGHNFGLGHNFAGSSDEPNFPKKADGTYAYLSSSVMDYPARDFDLYNQAGLYDVAAIRYLYARSIETKDGRIVSIKPKQSAFDAARAANAEPKPYEVCNDTLNNDNLPLYNPLCLKWDIGATPSQFVDWAISQVHADIIQNGYAYNDIILRGAGSSLDYFFSFRQIHDYWRFLMYEDAGKNLEKFNPKDLDAYIAARSAKDVKFRNYTEATYKIFDFFMELINLPGRVCVVTDTAQGKLLGIEEFRRLRTNIYQETGKTVQNCVEATPFLAAIRPAYANQSVTVEDRGHEIKNLELNLDPESTADRLKRGFDFADRPELNPSYSTGSMVFKLGAMNMLIARRPVFGLLPSLQLLSNAGMAPNFLDNPNFLSRYIGTTLDQIIDGASASQIGLGEPGTFLPYFEENSDAAFFMIAKLLDPMAGAVSAISVRNAFQLTPWTTNQTLPEFVVKAVENDPKIYYTKRKQGIFFAGESQRYAALILRQHEMLKQAGAYEFILNGLPQEIIRSAQETSEDPSPALVAALESMGNLYLQPFQYQKLSALITASATRQADGKLLYDASKLQAAVASFFKSETEIMGWPKAEFEAAVRFSKTLPDNYSAQMQLLISIIENGII